MSFPPAHTIRNGDRGRSAAREPRDRPWPRLVGELGRLVHVVPEPARDRDLGPAAALFDRRLLFLLFPFFVHRSSIPAQPLFGAAGVKRSALFRLDRQRPPRRAAFGNPDLEEAVLEARANRVRVEGRVNLDLALERPEPDLHLLETIDCPGRRRSPDAAQPHHRSHHVHAQILPPNPRHLETQDDLVSRLEHISRRLPAISVPQAVGEFAVQLDQGMGTILLGNPSSPA